MTNRVSDPLGISDAFVTPLVKAVLVHHRLATAQVPSAPA